MLTRPPSTVWLEMMSHLYQDLPANTPRAELGMESLTYHMAGGSVVTALDHELHGPIPVATR